MRYVWLCLSVAALGCASQERQIPAGSTVIYDSATKGGPDWFSFCDDKANLLYMSKDKSQPVVAIKDGCKPKLPDVPVAPVASAPAPVVQIPQPFIVHVTPTETPKVSTLELPREPLVIQLQPLPLAAAPAVSAKPGAKPLGVIQWKLDPNTAVADDLERLPGVTVQDAQAILRGRPYRTLRDLVDKSVLTEAQLKAVTPYLVIR